VVWELLLFDQPTAKCGSQSFISHHQRCSTSSTSKSWDIFSPAHTRRAHHHSIPTSMKSARSIQRPGSAPLNGGFCNLLVYSDGRLVVGKPNLAMPYSRFRHPRRWVEVYSLRYQSRWARRRVGLESHWCLYSFGFLSVTATSVWSIMKGVENYVYQIRTRR